MLETYYKGIPHMVRIDKADGIIRYAGKQLQDQAVII